MLEAAAREDATVAARVSAMMSMVDQPEISPLVSFDPEADVGEARALLESGAEVETPHGRLRIDRLLSPAARIGDTEVYCATRVEDDETVALKVLVGSPWNAERRRRFRLEAWVQGVCIHPGIAGLLATGSCEVHGHDYPAIVMEFVAGERFDVWAESARPVDVARALAVVGRAVHHANLRGVIHRDLKPANIVVAPDGTPKVLDFGVAGMIDALVESEDGGTGGSRPAASLASEGFAVVGTLPYMAPEQFVPVGRGIDLRTDVYALGCILGEIISGEGPTRYGPADRGEAYRQKLETPAPRRVRAGLPPGLADVFTIACDPDPDRRHESCAEFADEIERALAVRPLRRRPPGVFGQIELFARRRPYTAGLILVAGLFAVTAAGIYVQSQRLLIEQGRLSDQRFDIAWGDAAWLIRDFEQDLLLMRRSTPQRRALVERIRSTLDKLLIDPRSDAALRYDAAYTRARLGELYSIDFGEYETGAEQFRAAISLAEGLDDPRADVLRHWAEFNLTYSIPLEYPDYEARTADVYGGLLELDDVVSVWPEALQWRSKVASYFSRRMLDMGKSAEEIRGVLDGAVADARAAAGMPGVGLRAYRSVAEALYWRAHYEIDLGLIDPEIMIAELDAASEVLRGLGDPYQYEVMIRARELRGRVALDAGRFDDAIGYFNAGGVLARRISNHGPMQKAPFRMREFAAFSAANAALRGAVCIRIVSITILGII
ncbi:MAG: serine/threonine-protein kinase [Planctomycetota bacterium]